jgi:hypothetical protein
LGQAVGDDQRDGGVVAEAEAGGHVFILCLVGGVEMALWESHGPVTVLTRFGR